MTPIIECIPNFSDARRPEVVAAIRQAIADVPGAHVLDLHSDTDHNRSVITFVGSRENVGEAALRVAESSGRLLHATLGVGSGPGFGFGPVGLPLQAAPAAARRTDGRMRRIGVLVGVRRVGELPCKLKPRNEF